MAAVKGTVDFRDARVLDTAWWRRLKLLLGGVQREYDAEILTALFNYDLALVANSGLSEDSFKAVQKSAKDAFEKLHAVYRPWLDFDEYAVRMSEAEQHREAYKALIGDLEDPEYLAERNRARMEAKAEEDAAAKKAAEEVDLTDDEFVVKRREETSRMLSEIMQDRKGISD